jgi:NSS family neurotransmitter:Na+ symporter
MEHNKWSRNIFFVLATIGAAVGLGNLWRFPSMAYQYGGAAFYLPYIVCYLLVGLPVIYLEFGMGLWSKGSVAQSFKKQNSRSTWIGWWILINSCIIVFYYTCVMAWSLQYTIYSLNETWGNDTRDFFFSKVLHLTNSPLEIGSFGVPTVIALAVIWAVVYFSLKSGVKGLSRILLVTVPVPLLLLIVMAIRGLSLPGGIDGAKYFLVPDLHKILNINVWSAAASQMLLALSLGMGQMVAYSSMRKDSSKIMGSGLALIFGDFIFSFFSGIVVFATLGAMLLNTGQTIDTFGISGPSLAFVTYPAAISALPFAPVWGFLFFLMLVLIGIDSVFAVVEANLTDLTSVFPKVHKNKLLLIFCIICFAGGLLFTTGSGMLWLDIVDHWVGNFAIFSIIFLQCIVFGHSKRIKEIGSHLGNWFQNHVLKIWRIWLAWVLPLLIVIILTSQFVINFSKPYGNYPWNSILIGGWGVMILVVCCALIIARKHNKVRHRDFD